MPRWLKVELHAHTREDPDDHPIVDHSARELISAAAAARYEVLSITNHNQLCFTKELERFAADKGILLIPGVEATLEGKHVLLYNFKNYQPSWRSFQEVARRKTGKKLVVAPHPFFPVRSALQGKFFQHQQLFDAIEYSYFHFQYCNFNRKAARVARERNLPLVGSSDLHQLDQLNHTFTLVYTEKSRDAVLEAITQGWVRLVSQPVRARDALKWLGWNVVRRAGYRLSSWGLKEGLVEPQEKEWWQHP